MRAGLIGAVLLGTAGLAQAQTAPLPSHSPPVVREPAGAALAGDEMRELLDSARATAKATREAVDYNRVVPDILTQILAKLDKIEDKLDKVENAVKGTGATRRR